MLIGADSWYPPSQKVLNLLKEIEGFSFYGGYLNHWTYDDWRLIKRNGLHPLPIWIPDWSRSAVNQTTRSMRYARRQGLHGVVALDTTIGITQLVANPFWVDDWCLTLNKRGWHPIEHSHYRHSSHSFVWLVMWGEHDELPRVGEAIQHGPYTLFDKSRHRLMKLVADVADEHFPFATFTEPKRSMM